MLAYFSALSLAALIIYFNDRQRPVNRYAALFLLSSAIGGLTELIDGYGWSFASALVQFLNYSITPAAVLLFSLAYAQPANNKLKRFKALLLLPVLLQAGAALMFTQQTRAFFIIMLLWAAPYYLYSCYLLLQAYRRESHPQRKRNRFITTIIIVPTLLAVLLFIYAAKAAAPDFPFFNYIAVFIVYSFGIACLSVFIYGVLGVKLTFEKDPLEGTLKAVGAGTALLNHTIKNEIAKIAVSSDNLMNMVSEKDKPASEQLQIIAKAAEHMNEMVSRIHSQTKEIQLHEREVSLSVLLADCLQQRGEEMDERSIQVRLALDIKPVVLCDPVHIREAVNNICSNAIEAMPHGGVLEARLALIKGCAAITISDTGCGMDEQELRKAFEPFYSSGKQRGNYGLGLSYVYHVMQRSGGTVVIESDKKAGTKVTLLFNRRKRKGEANGQG